MNYNKDIVKTVVKSEPISVPRVCILTLHDAGAYRTMAELTIYQNKREYAERWKHDLLVLTQVNPEFAVPAGHAGGLTWDRLRVALEIGKTGRYDWLYLVGCDALITNMTIPLTTFLDDKYHFIIANDCCEWNADSFFFRCSLAGIGFMEAVMAEYERLKHHPWVEQQAMIELRDKPPWSGTWKVLPQREINSYDYRVYPASDPNCQPAKRHGKDCAGNDGQWQPGDFLIHWAGVGINVRIVEIKKTLPLIVR
jgi:hypothetical protein